ncbi:MAG: ankyrin repeat domain-containing protein [Planctomycetes bacterium]|nr:ankyrin repeat domain-containing protein [Planctomycetota bacterium]
MKTIAVLSVVSLAAWLELARSPGQGPGAATTEQRLAAVEATCKVLTARVEAAEGQLRALRAQADRLGNAFGMPTSGGKAQADLLLRSAQAGNLAAVQRILATGQDPNRGDGHGVTPLMHAAGSGHLDVVQALLAAKANPRLADAAGRSAWMHASEQGHLATVQALLAAKDTNAVQRDRQGRRRWTWPKPAVTPRLRPC